MIDLNSLAALGPDAVLVEATGINKYGPNRGPTVVTATLI